MDSVGGAVGRSRRGWFNGPRGLAVTSLLHAESLVRQSRVGPCLSLRPVAFAWIPVRYSPLSGRVSDVRTEIWRETRIRTFVIHTDDFRVYLKIQPLTADEDRVDDFNAALTIDAALGIQRLDSGKRNQLQRLEEVKSVRASSLEGKIARKCRECREVGI